MAGASLPLTQPVPTRDRADADPKRRIRPVSWVLVTVFAAANLGLGLTVATAGLRGDFACTYMGASLVRDGHFKQLYDFRTQANWWHAHAISDKPLVPYVRPPFYAGVQSLAAELPLGTSFLVNVIVLSLMLIGCWVWFARTLGEEALVLAALFWPSALGIAFGQDCVLMLALAVLSYHLHRRGRDGWAGAVLALALYKYHLLLLVGPAMLMGRRRRMFAGFAAVAAAEALVSFALVGRAGILSYISLLFRKDLEGLYPSPQLMPDINGLLRNFGVASTLAVIVLSGVMVACALAAGWRAPWWRGLAAAIAGSILIVPHVFGYDLTVLLLGLMLAIRYSKSKFTRGMAVWLCAPLVHIVNLLNAPWAALLPVSLVLLVAALGREFVLDLMKRPATADYS